jgi:hypothetical protein
MIPEFERAKTVHVLHCAATVIGTGGTATLFASSLDGGEWSASSADRFIPGEKSPGTHWREN